MTDIGPGHEERAPFGRGPGRVLAQGRRAAALNTVPDALAPASSAKPAPGRLVVVSNRVAIPRQDKMAGGLAVAIGEALSANGGLWVGWSGTLSHDAADREPRTRNCGDYELMTLDLTDREYAGYYQKFANQSLWPLLHYRSDLVSYDRPSRRIYHEVNRRIARTMAPALRPDDIVWIHDFHLLPLGSELRRLGCDNPIGFFLHIPFPPRQVVETLPDHQKFFRSLLAYDLVGVQTHADLVCLRNYLHQTYGAETAITGAFPVGIDVDSFTALGASPDIGKERAVLRRSLGDRALMVGVDRLDYTKGLPERLAAYRAFLERFEAYRNRVVFAQVCPPTREQLEPYAKIREELDGLEGAIHGAFAEFDWTPLRYIRRPVSRTRLAALYRTGRVGLVTPLRDGMNLVAKEYVAAQDPADPGVLILSRHAGAAEAMDRALLVNPYDIEAMAAAMHTALGMPLDERKDRHGALLDRIRRDDVHAWHEDFLRALKAAARARQRSGGRRGAALAGSAARRSTERVPAPATGRGPG